jgi:hypothetical protein
MQRHLTTKLQTMSARHPGLLDKMDAMFAEYWAVSEVKQMLEKQYGERLSRTSLERYRSTLWRARRELVLQAGAALSASQQLGDGFTA